MITNFYSSNKSTLDKPIGLLVNGVELYSPTIFDESIYYGEIEEVNVLNPGTEFDLINPPSLFVIDDNGQDAEIIGNIKGKLQEVLVLSPGIGYSKKPTLSLVGGNAEDGTELETNLVKKSLIAQFIPNEVNVSSIDRSITFITPHSFEDNEELIYSSNGLIPINQVVNGSYYYVGIVDDRSIKIYNNKQDAINRVNPVPISVNVGIHSGLHEFRTKNIKNVIDKVYIKSTKGFLYNRTVKVPSILFNRDSPQNSISPANDFIYAKSHNFREKDIVIYETTGSVISGLSTTNKYYISLVNENIFKLCDAGSNDVPDPTNYENKVFVGISSIGAGYHTFKYEPVSIKISTVTGISSTRPPVLEPVVSGEFDSVFIVNPGYSYGSEDIINYHKRPDIRVGTELVDEYGFEAEAVLFPIIIDGKIIGVQILNSGNNYENDIEIIVEGSGKYAKLYPIISEGKIVDVSVLSTGSGYTPGKTLLTVSKKGSGARFLVNLKKWTIDQYKKNQAIIKSSPSEGMLIPSRNNKNTLQFINFYPPKKLLDKINDTGLSSSNIIGWAYDGNPIYGPFIKENNVVNTVSSGYILRDDIESLVVSNKRPNFDIFPVQSFIEDYIFNSENTNLDENNSQYLDPSIEFPTGTNAYYYTMKKVGDEYIPEYPYIIGPKFKDLPILNNFRGSYNQNISFESEDYVMNTSPLYLLESNSGYQYIKSVDDKYKQELLVKNTLRSGIDEIKVIHPGEGYKVNDDIKFNTESLTSTTPICKVSRVIGKDIASFNIGVTTFTDVKYYTNGGFLVGITTIPHQIQNGFYVGLTTVSDSSLLPLLGPNQVEVRTKDVDLQQSISASTGISTYIVVNDIFDFEVDDFVQIDNEILKITSISSLENKLSVLRAQLNTSQGIHTYGTSKVKLLPTRFYIKNNTLSVNIKATENVYFNPSVSVGLGITGSYYNIGVGNSYFVPSRQIYIKDHGFSTNDSLKYEVGPGGSSLSASTTGTGTTSPLTSNSVLYAIKYGNDYLGLSVSPSTNDALYFRGNVSNIGNLHSFQPIFTNITGNIEVTTLNIVTESAHQLETNDVIQFYAPTNSLEYDIVSTYYNLNYRIQKINSTSFFINLPKIPTNLVFDNINNVKYNTTSLTADGGIYNVKVKYSGSSYSKLPLIEGIITENGHNAKILPYSDKIGKIDTVEIIKSGFDYPSDVTISPKLSTTTIAYLDNIYKIKEVIITYGGRNYNTPPKLKVIGNDKVILDAVLTNSIISEVIIKNNVSNLPSALDIIATNNSNGYEISEIEVLSIDEKVRIKLNTIEFPLIYRDYEDPVVDFPFEVGDLIYIENCIVSSGDNYNSIDYGYQYFEIVDVDVETSNIYYDISGIGADFGVYDPSSSGTYGTVVNKKDMATFEMVLDKGTYLPGEFVFTFDLSGNIKFTGTVMEDDGWNMISNQLRIENSQGSLDIGDIVYGKSSLLEGKVIDVNDFNLRAKLGATRDKINYLNVDYGDLNNPLKRLHDSNYYQEFSYSIVSQTPYSKWSEPVKSIVHPSGYKEFSDLQVVSIPKNKATVGIITSSLEFVIKIDNEKSFATRNNYTVAYEEFDDVFTNSNRTERIYFGAGQYRWPVAGVGNTFINGINLLPYILNKTNNVVRLKDISSQFTGNYDLINIKTENVTFDSATPYYLGVSTSGLQVGDIISYSQYHSYPENTTVKSVGIGSIQLWNPHTLYEGTYTEELTFTRRLNNNQIVGITSFTLKSIDNLDIFSINVDPIMVDLDVSRIVTNHYFQKGQKIKYENIGGSPIQIETTSLVEGGISTSTLPSTLYVKSTTLDTFTVSGLSTSSELKFTNIGSGIHKFTFENPNNCCIITIDNVIQAPLYLKEINLNLSSSIGVSTDILYVSSGINSITSNDILRIDDEYLLIKSIGVGSSTEIEVERGAVGSISDSHNINSQIKVYGGNYNILDNSIYFTSPPYGSFDNPERPVFSQFSGRVFTRSFSGDAPNDINVVFDDISNQFTGNDTFKLKQNGVPVVGVYTNTNSTTNINNNPLILVNNIPQDPETSFDTQTIGSNEIIFLDDYPSSGKLLRVGINTTSGYMPLVGASATVSVSLSGEIENVYLTGAGSGYREAPSISILSNVGSGGSISATIGASGTITSLNITNSGSGYVNGDDIIVNIDEPLPYSRINLGYLNGSSGIGTDAKISVSIGSSGDIINFKIDNYGKYYKVGDVLTPVGIITNPSYVGSFIPLELTVEEVFSDIFSGVYLGQFIKFSDISDKFNSIRKAFDLYAVLDGENRKITLRLPSTSTNVKIENNFVILINDIIQEPVVSYIYSGDRIVFREAPKAGSKCSILFYRGSSRDVEEVIPLETIKEGDTVKFEDSELSLLDNDQLERVVKRLVSASSLDTFTYSGYGIIDLIPRPLTWEKQSVDRIINGSLVSKSRPEYKSKSYPTCKLIKSMTKNDSEIYVDNAYPLFSDLDNLREDKKNIRILNDGGEGNSSLAYSQVSTSSSISSIIISSPGIGYTLPPSVSIGNSSSITKDILYKWENTSGISTSYKFNSIYSTDILVSVGNSNLIGISTNIVNWTYDTVQFGQIFNLHSVIISPYEVMVAVGSSGSILVRDNESGIWNFSNKKIQIVDELFVPSLIDSNYSGTFNQIIYSDHLNIYVAVGDDNKIYCSTDEVAGTFVEASIISDVVIGSNDFKAIAHNQSYFVALGTTFIAISLNGMVWSVTANNIGNPTSIIWDTDKFIATSSLGVFTSIDGFTWSNVSPSTTDFNKLSHYQNQYIAVSSTGDLYYSFDLAQWYLKDNNTSEIISDFTQCTKNNQVYYIFVGTNGFIRYTIPEYNYASATSNITDGQVVEITITNGGFGYSIESPPPILISPPSFEYEDISTFEVIGDFGTIVGINTFPIGTLGIGTDTPKIEFELKTNYYDNDNLGIGYSSLNVFGINYSQLNVGDFFVIHNSNVICGHALTGITATSGGMSNYPASKVGTTTSFIDGVYKVEAVVAPNTLSGITTVSCNFVPVNGGIDLNVVGINTTYYGSYSWSKIYDYDDRLLTTSKNFNVNTDNGLIGISTAPTVYRKLPLIF